MGHNIHNQKVGNQIDCYYRQMSMEEGIELAMNYNCPFIEASAKYRFNVDISFDIAVDYFLYLNHKLGLFS